MTVALFPKATTAFNFHVGSSDPPGASSKAPLDAGSSISASEAPLVTAAFNGGFKRDAGAGGMIVDGIEVSPMLNGKATVGLTQDGAVEIGVWGTDLPGSSAPPVDARQNLQLLVDGGVATSASRSTSDAVWGGSVSGAVTARSGLGVDKSGNVYYVASMRAIPYDLAEAMVSVGVVRGIQLDMNPYWIDLGTATTPGAPMVSRVPGQNRPASIFSAGWQRDFMVVLAQPSRACRLVFPAPVGVPTADPPLVKCAPLHEASPPSGL